MPSKTANLSEVILGTLCFRKSATSPAWRITASVKNILKRGRQSVSLIHYASKLTKDGSWSKSGKGASNERPQCKRQEHSLDNDETDEKTSECWQHLKSNQNTKPATTLPARLEGKSDVMDKYFSIMSMSYHWVTYISRRSKKLHDNAPWPN